MQIIIEIDDEDYNRLKEIPYVFDSLVSRLYESVKNGTPIPKEHGDLIYRDDAIKAIYRNYVGGKVAVENSCITDMYANAISDAVDSVDDVPIIIEADRGEEE